MGRVVGAWSSPDRILRACCIMDSATLFSAPRLQGGRIRHVRARNKRRFCPTNTLSVMLCRARLCAAPQVPACCPGLAEEGDLQRGGSAGAGRGQMDRPHAGGRGAGSRAAVSGGALVNGRRCCGAAADKSEEPTLFAAARLLAQTERLGRL